MCWSFRAEHSSMEQTALSCKYSCIFACASSSVSFSCKDINSSCRKDRSNFLRCVLPPVSPCFPQSYPITSVLLHYSGFLPYCQQSLRYFFRQFRQRTNRFSPFPRNFDEISIFPLHAAALYRTNMLKSTCNSAKSMVK